MGNTHRVYKWKSLRKVSLRRLTARLGKGKPAQVSWAHTNSLIAEVGAGHALPAPKTWLKVTEIQSESLKKISWQRKAVAPNQGCSLKELTHPGKSLTALPLSRSMAPLKIRRERTLAPTKANRKGRAPRVNSPKISNSGRIRSSNVRRVEIWERGRPRCSSHERRSRIRIRQLLCRGRRRARS